MRRACANYSRWPAGCKGLGLVLVLLLALPLLLLSRPASALSLVIDSGPGSLLGFDWQRLQLEYALADRDSRAWQLSISDLTLSDNAPPLDLIADCRRLQLSDSGSECSEGEVQIAVAQTGEAVRLALRWSSTGAGGYRVFLDHDALSLQLDWPGPNATGEPLGISLARLDLGLLPSDWAGLLSLDVLAGELVGDFELDGQALRGQLGLEQGLFDGLEGQIAGDGLKIALQLALDRSAPVPTLAVTFEQTAGELLLGSVYLPEPAAAVRLDAELVWHGAASIELSRFQLSDPGALELGGSALLAGGEQAWSLESLRLDQLSLEFPLVWDRWLDGPAAAAGFAGLETAGAVNGSLYWAGQHLQSLDLAFIDLSLDDPQERLAFYGLDGRATGDQGASELSLDWHSAALFGLPFGPAGLRLHHDEVGLRLLDRLRIPLLDGAVVIEGLAWFDLDELPSRLVLDVAIEPVSLVLLTSQLGWPEFGGQLSGRFPGVEYAEERLAFTGGMAIEAFSGHIRVEDLTVERPFGSLPALAAQLEFDRLDLLELTGAFNFGRMEGQMSGWARDLRLLDWRPVAMDTRIFTHEDVARRRISQRAVDNLSSLGGAGGAMISSTLLRVFEDFPYRRAGLACRLGNNICHIDGVARHESGGFLIVEGRGLPRLDIVGHRRLVDWPQLVGQLEAMLEAEER